MTMNEHGRTSNQPHLIKFYDQIEPEIPKYNSKNKKRLIIKLFQFTRFFYAPYYC